MITPAVAKESALTKKVKVSAELGALLGVTEISRTEVTKAIWLFIKQNNLQDPKDKRVIVPNAALATILGTEPVNMLVMTKLVNTHFVK